MDIGFFAFVKLRRELVFLEQFRHTSGRRNISSRQRSQRCRIQILDVTTSRNELTVLVDDEHDFSVRVPDKTVYDCLNLVELLLVHHHLGIDHPCLRQHTSRLERD